MLLNGAEFPCGAIINHPWQDAFGDCSDRSRLLAQNVQECDQILLGTVVWHGYAKE
jgi:hypothetical protein